MHVQNSNSHRCGSYFKKTHDLKLEFKNFATKTDLVSGLPLGSLLGGLGETRLPMSVH